MSQIDDKEAIVSEDTGGHSDGSKLVPVSESIRYRKRAQDAERKVENLAKELAQTKAEISEMSEELSNIQVEQKLTRRLAAAGAVDLETAVLIAKAKIDGSDDADLDGVIAELKKEKQYLFRGANTVVAAKKTAGAKDRLQNSQTILERAAKKAATTGNRTDLQEYLRLRRSFV
ncbi:MAG: hypothetical protein AMJ43_06405 [Coxiella sp. DG_40]|nr:MAG: hypothetical protein AMJ43_06405 [Coxiella sp. DG_40]